MDRHAVPHSVTNFEFKLIGWFTVKQFMYLLIAVGLGAIYFFIIPVPYLNIVMAALSVLSGVIMVFYRYNDRPLDTWLKNLFISLTHPSQYLYEKENEAPAFLKEVYLATNAELAQIHLEASQKLHTYMATQGQKTSSNQDKNAMNTLIHSTPSSQPGQQGYADMYPPDGQPSNQAVTPIPDGIDPTHTIPYLSGIVCDYKEVPLPEIMVYLSTDAGQVVRILKTNHNGIFATFHALPAGTYIVSPKDLGGTHFFDTISVVIDGPRHEPISIFSKDIL